jgi:hypothetical protein
MKPGENCATCFEEVWPDGAGGCYCKFCGRIYKADKPAAAPVEPCVLAGLDLGKLRDFTAFAPCRRDPGEDGAVYTVLSLKRFELGTTYPKMVEKVTEWMTAPALRSARLVIDQTGVGVAVVDMFRADANLAGRVVPVLITGGASTGWRQGAFHVSKVQLVSALQSVVSGRRLRIEKDMLLARELMQELKKFSEKITKAGNQQFEAWREAEHDDLVLALALPIWVAENQPILKVITFTGSAGRGSGGAATRLVDGLNRGLMG